MKSKIFISFFIVFSFLLPASMALATQDGAQAVIFMYHRFGESRYPSTNITLEQFEEQLEFFEKNNFSVLPLNEIIEALKENKTLPDKSIGITIDDAYLSVYKEAYPRLKAKGYPFTVFVATGVVDQGIPAYMDWEQMAEMQKHGATQLACYIGNKKMNIHWSEPGRQFTIQTAADLLVGRSRYNCTAPDKNSNRYFWFSHPWLRIQKK